MTTWIIGYVWTTCWIVVVALAYDLDFAKKPTNLVALLVWPLGLPYLGIRKLFR
jgi:hypothetical protein